MNSVYYDNGYKDAISGEPFMEVDKFQLVNDWGEYLKGYTKALSDMKEENNFLRDNHIVKDI